MKPPVLPRIVKLAMVTSLAALFVLLTFGSVFATTAPDRASQLLPPAAPLLVPATSDSPAVGTAPTTRDNAASPQLAIEDNANVVRPLPTGVSAQSSSIFFTGSVPLISDTLSQDWGDFDRDGNLDLALGTSSGISIYHNLAGQLVFSRSLVPGPIYGVRWADLNNDGLLELVAVRNQPGANGIYRYNGSSFISYTAFASSLPLARVTALIFNGNRRDLIVSTSAISTACSVWRYQNNGAGYFTDTLRPPLCVSSSATAGISAGDFDNDGDSDLVLGSFPNEVKLLINNGTTLTETQNSYTFDTALSWPYDFAWGDYDGDERFDLAVSFPLQRQVRVYHNNGLGAASPLTLSGVLPTQRFMTPLSIDWGDFNGDGDLDLAVADDPPRIYFNVNHSIGPNSEQAPMSTSPSHDSMWSTRAAALDNTSLSLLLSAESEKSQLYPIASGHLAPKATSVMGAIAAHSLAWGDVDGNGRMDLLLGAVGSTPSTLYWNVNGSLAFTNSTSIAGSGQRSVALANLNKYERSLEIIIGDSTSVRVYTRTANGFQVINTLPVGAPVSALATGDYNSDDWLDLLVGTEDGGLLVYRNANGAFVPTPAFTAQLAGQIRDVAWADYDNDYYMDFAVAISSGYARVYHNSQDGRFAPVIVAQEASSSTAVAWADFTNDGFLDLTVGTDGEGIRIHPYNSSGGSFSPAIWASLSQSHTTSLAWGDWDNDRRLDLAAGNAAEPIQVFANLQTESGPQLIPMWTSAETGATAGIAWGDVNNDGYLDLGVARGDGQNGVHYNTVVVSGQIPNPSSFVSIARPGRTFGAYLYSAPEFMPGYFSNILPPTLAQTVTVYYSVLNPVKTPITNTLFEFSLDGGSSWSTATPAAASPRPITQTSPLGQAGIFIWNARGDQAFGDNVLFRVRVVDQQPIGPFQRAATAAVSPPFRARAMTCQWPGDLTIDPPDGPVDPGESARFVGLLGVSSGGGISYTWIMDDKDPAHSTITGRKEAVYIYKTKGFYTITLEVNTPDCPGPRPVKAILPNFKVGEPDIDRPYKIYLPLVRHSSATAQATVIGKDAGNNPHRKASVATSIGGKTTCISKTVPPSSRPVVAWLTGTTGYYGQPALNYDGSRFAFWSTANLTTTNPDGSIELYYAQVDRLASCVTFTQITSSTGSILEGFSLGPALNAEGDRIVFFSDRDLTGDNPDNSFEVFLARINPNESISVTQVTNSAWGINALPTINAIGDRIAFVSDQNLTGSNSDGSQEIFSAVIDESGQAPNPIQVTQTDRGTFNDEPSLRGDGQRVVFVRGGAQTSGIQEIFLGDATAPNSSLLTVTASPANVLNYRPTIGGGSSQYAIAYAATDLTREIVNLATVAGTSVNTKPVYTATRNSLPALNVSTGSRLMVVSGTQYVNVLVPGIQSVIPITCAGANCPYAAISGDGMHVIFTAKRGLREAYYETAALSLVLNEPAAPVVAGTKLTRTLKLTNGGPSLADGVEFTSTLQDNATALLPVTFTISSDSLCLGNTTVNCHIAGLAVSSPVYITLTTVDEIDAGRLEPITLTVDANAWQADPVAVNRSFATAPEADLRVAKTVATTGVAGELVTYTLTITNVGPSHARNVTLTDRLPASLISPTLSMVSGPTFTLANTGSMVTGTIGYLQRNAPAKIRIVAELNSTVTVGQIISNTGVITSETYDRLPVSNQSLIPFAVTTRSEPTVTKSALGIVIAGSPLTYTIIVTNNGPSATSNLILTDVLPSRLTIVTDTVPNGCSSLADRTLLTCNLTDLDKEGSHTITFTVETDSEIEENTRLINTVLVSATNAVKTVSNTATTQTGIGSLVRITKTATLSVTAGNSLIYTITVGNHGPSLARYVTMTDRLPTGYISYTKILSRATYNPYVPPQCDYVMGTITCTMSLINNGQKIFMIYATSHQTLPVNTAIVNTARAISGTSLIPVIDTATTVISDSISQLTAAKSADTTVLAGNSVHYTVVVTNSGPSYAPYITVTDHLPPSVVFTSTGSSPTCSSSDGSNVSCSLQALLVGAAQRQTVTIAGMVSYTVPSGTALNNTAEITASNAVTSVNVSALTTVRTSSQLDIDKTATEFVTTVTKPTAASEIVTYTIVVTNSGPSLARNVVLTDVLPVSVTYLSQVSANPPVTPTVTGLHTLTWALSTITPNTTSAITFQGEVHTSTVGLATLTNTAYVTATTAPAVVTATASTQVLPRAELAIEKTSVPLQAIKNTNLTYQITVTNLGPSVVPSVTISDVLPVNAIQFSAHFDYTPGCSEEPLAGDPQYVICNTPPLSLGEHHVVTISARISNQAPTVFTNTAYATSTIATAVVSDSVASSSLISTSLLVTKTLVNAEVIAGQNITYAITVASKGPSAAPNVILTDTLPTEIISATGSTGCGPLTGNHTMLCAQALVLTEAPHTFTITGQLTSGLAAPKIITNEVQASTTATTTIATDSLTTTVKVRANLEIGKRAAATARAGELLTYTISVTNTGPSIAPSIRITDRLPISVTYLGPVDSAPPISPPTSTGGVLTWTLSSLAPSATQIITFNVRITDTVGGSARITNTAYVTSTSALQVTSAPAGTNVQDQTYLAITKTLLTANPISGEDVTYGITVTNLGPSAILSNSLTITDQLPSELAEGDYGLFNLALNRPVTSSLPSCAADEGPEKAVNGSVSGGLDDKWCNDTGSRWMQVDLGSTLNVTRFVVSHAGAGGEGTNYNTRAFNILTSADGTNFTQVVTVTNNASSVTAHTIAATTARFVRLQVVTGAQPGNPNTARIYEFEVYGSTSRWSASPNCAVYDALVTCVKDSPLGVYSSWGVTITGKISSNVTAAFTNTAYATSPIAVASVSSSAVTTPALKISLQVAKSAASDVLAGNRLAYVVVVGNGGPSVAPSVVVTDPLPAELIFPLASPGCTPVAGVITCQAFSLEKDASRTITITGQVITSTPAGTAISNRVYVSSSTPATSTSSSPVTTLVDTQVNVQVAKLGQPSVLAGNTLTYTILITNEGPSLARFITVTDRLTSSLTIGGMPGECGQYNGVITCTLSNVDVGPLYSRLIVLTPTVNSGVFSGTQIVNRAVVVTGTTLIKAMTGTVTTTVWTEADLAITTDIAPTTVLSNTGGLVKVTINFVNVGPSDARSVYITETLDNLTYTTFIAKPAYVGDYSGNCSNGSAPHRCYWFASTLTKSLAGTIEFTATAPGTGFSYSQSITASIGSAVSDSKQGNNTDTTQLSFAQAWPRMYWAGLLPIRWPVVWLSAPPRDFWSLSP